MMPHIHLLGVGSIGSLFAYHLVKAGCQVTMLLQSSIKVQAYNAAGGALKIERQTEGCVPEEVPISAVVPAVMEPPDRLTSSARSHQHATLVQTLLVATKAQDTAAALLSVKHLLPPDSVVILVQNGLLGVYEEVLTEVFPDAATRPLFILGSVTHGCFRKADFHIVHAGVGKCIFGSPDLPEGFNTSSSAAAAPPSSTPAGGIQASQPPAAPANAETPSAILPASAGCTSASSKQASRVGEVLQLLSSLEPLNVDCSLPYQQLMQQLYLKVAINCCANPITALLRCRLGDAVDNADVLHIQLQLCHEFKAVFGDDVQYSAQELYGTAVHVQQINAQNTTSMLADVLARRSTEIEYINGFVAKHATERGVAVPYNEMLWRLVRAKQVAGEVASS
jgi:2-dehydropantoate 2-reductase